VSLNFISWCRSWFRSSSGCSSCERNFPTLWALFGAGTASGSVEVEASLTASAHMTKFVAQIIHRSKSRPAGGFSRRMLVVGGADGSGTPYLWPWPRKYAQVLCFDGSWPHTLLW